MYIDPQSGGMLFQVLLVIFGVFSGAILLFYSRIKMGVARLRRSVREKREGGDSLEADPGPDQS
jgi:hypothetical protein